MYSIYFQPSHLSQTLPTHLPNSTSWFPTHSTGTYIPRKEVEEVRVVEAVIIFSNQAIRLKARKENIDKVDG